MAGGRGRDPGKGNMASLQDDTLQGPVGVEETDLLSAGITVLEYAHGSGWTGAEFQEVLEQVTGVGVGELRGLIRGDRA